MFVFFVFFFFFNRFVMGRKCNTVPGTFYMAGYTSLITLRGIKKKEGTIDLEVVTPLFWLRGGRLTCDVGRHQPFSPDDLHLHDTHVFQVLEGPPHALERWGGRRGGRKGCELAQERKSGQ